jgi:hypothetical protein
MTHSRLTRNVRTALLACAVHPIAVHAATPAQLNNLPHHYGTNASPDAAAVNELATWLTANAYKRVREAPPEDSLARRGSSASTTKSRAPCGSAPP